MQPRGDSGNACRRPAAARGHPELPERAGPPRRGRTRPRVAADQYRPRSDATLSLLTVLMLWHIARRPISRRYAILFVHRSALPYLALMALKIDSTVDLAW